MSIQFGRVTIADPLAWDEPVGDKVDRVGGIPVPAARAGVRVDADLIAGAEPGQGTAAQRLTVRRQLRSLLNNPLARFQGVWVAWDGDDEQSGWYVPGEGTMAVEVGQFPQSFYRATGLALELVGRPRTHRRAVLVRARDLRLATEPKDTLRRVYGRMFDGSGGVGTNVTPAPIVWLPSDAADVVSYGTGTPAVSLLGLTTSGRSSSGQSTVDGAGDLSIISFEQPAASRLLGDAVVYDRRGETAAPPSGGPHASWEEVYGRDWPWTGWLAMENYSSRVWWDDPNGVFVLEYWSGVAFTEYARVRLKARVSSTDYDLVSVRSVSVWEWSPDRAVVKLVMDYSSPGDTRCEVYVTLTRGWAGPRFEVYRDIAAGIVKVSIDPSGSISANTVPTTFTGSVNYGYIQAVQDLAVAVVQPSATSATVSGAVEIAGFGYVSAHLTRMPLGGSVATKAALFGADVLAGTSCSQAIVAR